MKELIAGKRSDSPDLRLKIGFGSPIQNVQPLLSPASLRSPSLPRPGGFIDELWASREVTFLHSYDLVLNKNLCRMFR